MELYCLAPTPNAPVGMGQVMPDLVQLFTPRVSASSEERLRMCINAEDVAKVHRGRNWRAIITDQSTGRRYLVRGAACGLPGCRCDAVIVESYGLTQ